MESEGIEMRAEYDFSSAKKNPYLELLKNQVTITLDENVVNFFKKQSESVGIPYQNLINLYLRDCMVHDRHP
ncbi:MAG: BrnA antitoxin family protein, partial [Oscillospiraceae bacterium]|nr:BrnA antitoxin family protein [Oscillospiraceae bacterium]